MSKLTRGDWTAWDSKPPETMKSPTALALIASAAAASNRSEIIAHLLGRALA